MSIGLAFNYARFNPITDTNQRKTGMNRSLFHRKKIKYLFLIIILAIIWTPQTVLAKKHHAQRHHHAALVDQTAAYSDIILNAETGQVLHETDPDSLRHPASLTKMMTLYLTFQAIENGKLGINQYLPISVNAAEQSPSKLGLRAGQRIRVEDAILGLVTESANDAAVVLGEWLGGSEEGFGQIMTRQAHALGMNHTRFMNPSGLPDPDQITTARDMAILGHALIYHFPQFYPYFSRDHFVYTGNYHHNHNHLMSRYDGMDGIKTGYIRASGFNLVASAKRGNTRLIGVVFGGNSAVARDNRMAELLDDAFQENQRDNTTTMRVSKTNSPPPAAQGDGNDSEDVPDDYMPLPSKTVSQPSASSPSPPSSMKGNVVKTIPAKPMQPSKQQDAIKTTSISGGNWGIQIGAYSDADIGRQALANITSSMPQILGSGEPQLQKIVISGTTLYRARLMDLDQKTAQNVCSYLTQHGQSCLTVGP